MLDLSPDFLVTNHSYVLNVGLHGLGRMAFARMAFNGKQSSERATVSHRTSNIPITSTKKERPKLSLPSKNGAFFCTEGAEGCSGLRNDKRSKSSSHAYN